MSVAYFDDGTEVLELGAAPDLRPATERHTSRLSPTGQPGTVGACWGGRTALSLRTHRLRANLGDAERYGWDRLRALSLAGPGTLGVEDEFGRRSTWPACRCTGATARVSGERLATIDYRFATAEATATVPWTDPPVAPPPWPGRGTLQDYSAGVPLGDHATDLIVEMTRRAPLRTVPRARGARGGPPAGGAFLRLTLRSWLHRPSEELSGALAELLRSIDTGPLTLQANGNTYPGLRLERCSPRRNGPADLQFDLTFLQEIAP